MESPIDTNYKRRSLRESQLIAFSQKQVELDSEWSHFHKAALSGIHSKRKLNQSRTSHNKIQDSLNDSYGLKSTLKIKTKIQKKKLKENEKEKLKEKREEKIMPHYTKPLKKVITGLKKASKLHAKQSNTLKKIEKDQRTRYKNGSSKKKKK